MKLNRHNINIASKDSKPLIKADIEAALAWKNFKDTHIVTLYNYQDLLTCIRDIRFGIN